MYKLIRPLLFGLSKDPETTHNLALFFLRLMGVMPLRSIFEVIAKVSSPVLEQKVFGIDFKNPVGLAAGFEKSCRELPALKALGFGFIELGGYTKLAQPGNPRPRLFRLFKDEALINRMGFPNPGADKAEEYLSKKDYGMVLGVNIAKSKVTPNEEATPDYLYTFSKVYEHANFFVINVSSPNTPGLRQLQSKEFLNKIISAVMEYRSRQSVKKPILIKTVVDFSKEEIDELLEVCRNHQVDGIVCSNTSISREGLHTEINEQGGLSGKPIKERATDMIRYIHKASPELKIIGLGGIFTAEDAYEKIRAGASLVEIYTGFIYEGPFIAKKINQKLIKLLQKDGYKNIAEAVGKGN